MIKVIVLDTYCKFFNLNVEAPKARIFFALIWSPLDRVLSDTSRFPMSIGSILGIAKSDIPLTIKMSSLLFHYFAFVWCQYVLIVIICYFWTINIDYYPNMASIFQSTFPCMLWDLDHFYDKCVNTRLKLTEEIYLLKRWNGLNSLSMVTVLFWATQLTGDVDIRPIMTESMLWSVIIYWIQFFALFSSLSATEITDIHFLQCDSNNASLFKIEIILKSIFGLNFFFALVGKNMI